MKNTNIRFGHGALAGLNIDLAKAVAAKRAERISGEPEAIVIPQGAHRQGRGTVEHQIVRYKGEQIGTIQVRTFDGSNRVDILTISPVGGIRQGRQVKWLIEQAERDNWLAENKSLAERQARRRMRKNFDN